MAYKIWKHLAYNSGDQQLRDFIEQTFPGAEYDSENEMFTIDGEEYSIEHINVENLDLREVRIIAIFYDEKYEDKEE